MNETMVSTRTGNYGTYYGSTMTESEALTQSQMQTNVDYLYKAFSAAGWTLNAIAAICGNMEAESTINPGRRQSNKVGVTSMGYGLVQWTPSTKYTSWAQSEGYSDYSKMDTNIARILYEVANGIQWIARKGYTLSFADFTTSTKDVSYLTKAFMICYERPKDQSTSAQAKRANIGVKWQNYLAGNVFVPRLTPPISDMPYWINVNNGGFNRCIVIDSSTGSVLPNCTGYAWGRFLEEAGLTTCNLSTANAGLWYGYTDDGYERGSTPRLGAVLCLEDRNGGPGHVAIVEEIDSAGNITTSNSAYGGQRFFTATMYAADGYSDVDYRFQGFIYNPNAGGGVDPEPPVHVPKEKKGYNFVLFNRKRRFGRV